MTLPSNSSTVTTKLPDRMFLGGMWATELVTTFFLVGDREYTVNGQLMQTGVYEATIRPDTGDTLSFGITINKTTGFQQEVIDSLARAYAALYATGLYNAQEGTDFAGLQWPLNERVTENMTSVLEAMRPRGMGGAFRLYDPSLYASITTVIEPFWYDPIEHINIWISGLVYEDPGQSVELALLALGQTLLEGDDVVYADFRAVLDTFGVIVSVDEFFIDTTAPPTGTSDIPIAALQKAEFALSRIDIQESPPTEIEIWVEAVVETKVGEQPRLAVLAYGTTLGSGDDVIDADIRAALLAIPDLSIVHSLKIDVVYPLVLEGDYPIGVHEIADIDDPRVLIYDYYTDILPMSVSVQVNSWSGFTQLEARTAIYEHGLTLGDGDDVTVANIKAAVETLGGSVSWRDDSNFWIDHVNPPVQTGDYTVPSGKKTAWDLARIDFYQAPV